MASLSWKNLVPNIEVLPTQKIFYKQYLYKLELVAHGGQSINSKYSVAESLNVRERSYRAINYGGSWAVRMCHSLAKSNVEWLEYLKAFKASVNFDCKIRIEEPRIQIYANSEDELVDLVTNKLQSFVTNIEEISGPATDEAAEILNSGAIIRKTHNGYTHKVILRDGRYGPEIKEAILQYLDNLNIEMVNMSKSCRSMLSKSSSYIWNCYFYTNDPSIAMFLNLIQPGLVSNIHELVVAH